MDSYSTFEIRNYLDQWWCNKKNYILVIEGNDAFLWFYRVITTVEGLRGLMFAKTPHNCNSISRHHCLLPSNVRSHFDKLIWRRGKCFIFLKWNNVLVEIPLDEKNVHWSWNINLSSLTRPVLFLLQTGSHNNDSEKTCQTTACQEVIWYHGRFPVGTIATLFLTRLPLPYLYSLFLLTCPTERLRPLR